MTALLPPKTREATFRRARLCQFVSDTDGAFLPAGVWDGLTEAHGIEDGAEVVIALDGKLLRGHHGAAAGDRLLRPHFDVLAVWEPAEGERVPVADVEQAIRDACRRWQVAEIIYDPFRWTRTGQALESEGLPIVEFPHSASRLTAATTDLYSAAVNGRLSHSGDPRLAAHVAAAVITEDARGMRLSKASRQRTAENRPRQLPGHGPQPRHLARDPTQPKEDEVIQVTTDLLTTLAQRLDESTAAYRLSTPPTREPGRWPSSPRRRARRWETGSPA